MTSLQRWFLFPVLAAVLGYAGWVFLGRSRTPLPSSRTPLNAADQARLLAEFDRIYGGTDVRILMFYAPEGDVAEGARTTLCYGVVNARAVRIEPAVDGVGVSLNRCVAVTPEKETTYTLTAEGADGRTVTESLTLRTHADPDELPKIQAFRVDGKMMERGRPVFVLSFQALNAVEVTVDPPVIPTLRGAPMGRFAIAPDKTTTYTLKVVGKRGHMAEKKVTVEVGPPAS